MENVELEIAKIKTKIDKLLKEVNSIKSKPNRMVARKQR